MQQINLSLFYAINDLAGQWPVLDSAGVFFATTFGFVMAAAVYLYALYRWDKGEGVLARIAITLVFAGALLLLLRVLFPVSRPFVEHSVTLLLDSRQTNSFPSGHTTLYMALAAGTYLGFPRLGVFVGIGALLIGISRIFAGVHYPFDVVGGALVGVVAGVATYYISQQVKQWIRTLSVRYNRQ